MFEWSKSVFFQKRRHARTRVQRAQITITIISFILFPPFLLARAGAAVALTIIINQRARAAHGRAAAGAGHDHREAVLRKPASGNGVVRHFNAKFILNKVTKSFHFCTSFQFFIFYPFGQVYITTFLEKCQLLNLDAIRLNTFSQKMTGNIGGVMFPAPSYHILQRGERRESRNALAALWLLFPGNLFLSSPSVIIIYYKYRRKSTP